MKDKPGVELRTEEKPTWCPGCPDHMVMESTRRALLSLIEKGYKRESFAMACDIGCHGKIFDYLNLSGIYGLHGRAIPTAMGMKFGNPNLNVLVFAGDGATYSEGIEHFVHACRFNPNITLIVNDNQSFSLTTGQATPTSQIGFKTKVQVLGVSTQPLNPILLALSSGATFVARCNARDLDHTQKIIEQAIKHKGFSFVEIIQDCIVFNVAANNRDSRMYKLSDKKRSLVEAMKISMQFDYNLGEGKIPLGIIYQDEKKKSLEDNFPQLEKLMRKGSSWKDLKR
ncbi:2-oxoacid:ferredoxin oxidoreductase subunit beta [Candidatus Pacearchaeota archaeon]|nr:2-oxoacid:ferredoxin oxidoreductase subunit beta [Candidatus Pacearchaeota archaeon]